MKNLNIKKILASLVFGVSLVTSALAQSSSVTGTMPDSGGSLPSTCQVGYIYSKTSAAGGAIGLYFCNPANVLTAFPFTSNPFASGGTTVNVLTKSNGSSQLVDSAVIENGTSAASTVPYVGTSSATVPMFGIIGAVTTGIAMDTATSNGRFWLVTANARRTFGVDTNGQTVNLSSGAVLCWNASATDPAATGCDTSLNRDAAIGVLAMKQGNTPKSSVSTAATAAS